MRFWAYRFLVARDGERCLICQKGPAAKRQLEIDHIDNNPLNDNPDNLCLLCGSCNKKFLTVSLPVKKKCIIKAKKVCLCVSEREKSVASTLIVKSQVDYVKGSPEMQANDFFELDFRTWVLKQVRTYGNYPKAEAINSGAEIVGCSVVTSRRYLEKLLSAGGVLEEYRNPLRQTMLRFQADKKLPASGPVYIDDLIKEILANEVKMPERRE